jgi:hypothetical protein
MILCLFNQLVTQEGSRPASYAAPQRNVPAAVLPVLGHADPGDTFWNITGTAELLGAAARRLQQPGGNGEGATP